MDAALLTVLQLHLEKPAGDILLFLTGTSSLCQWLHTDLKDIEFVVTLTVFIGQEEIEHMTKLLEQKARTFGPEAMKARRGSSSCFCSSADLSWCACVLTWFLSFVSCSFARFTLPYRLRSRWRPSPRPRQAAARLFSPDFYVCPLSIAYVAVSVIVCCLLLL